MARLLRFADRMGIERLCVYMGTTFATDPTPEQLRQQNDEVLQAIGHWHDRAFGFVYLSPKYVADSLRELDRCVRDGPMVGVKLWVAGRCDQASLDPIVARATELGALVFQHTWYKTGAPARAGVGAGGEWTRLGAGAGAGNLPGESTPEELAILAARHPRAALVCGHAGGNWELGIRAVRASPNVAVDLGGSDPTTGFVELAVRELGAERVLFGSDVPGRSFASQLAKVRDAGISDEARRLILGENLRRLLVPILKAKGIEA